MIRTRYSILMLAVFACLGEATTFAVDVVSSASNGFSIRISREISAPSTKVFEVFVQEIGKWWDSAHTFSRDAKNLSIEAKPHGCFCESLARGGGVAHMTVTFVDPGKRLRMSGGLGPFLDFGVAGAMTLSLTEANAKTKLELVYNVGGYYAEGLDKLAGPANSVLEEQMNRLKRYIESGNPTESKD